MIVGSETAGSNARSGSGSAYVIYGRPNPTNVDLATLDPTSGFRIDGAAMGAQAGSAAAAGDVNADSVDDVIVGASQADNNFRNDSGSAYVIYGSPNPTNVDLATLDPTSGFRIDGAAGGDQAATSVAAAGDVNADNTDDVIVGAPFASDNSRDSSGSAYVIYGSGNPTNVDLATFDLPPLGARGFRIDGVAENYNTGDSVAGAGDVNADGTSDVIVGAFRAGANGRLSSGSAYVIYGSANPTNIDLAMLAARGFRIDGARQSDLSASPVAAAGDVNADGTADVIIGARGVNDFSGAAYVVYGSADSANVDLAALGARGFRISGGQGR